MTPAPTPPADAAPTPAAPGWYVRWDGGDRWRPVSADFAAWVIDGRMVEGDRVAYVTPEEPNHLHESER